MPAYLLKLSEREYQDLKASALYQNIPVSTFIKKHIQKPIDQCHKQMKRKKTSFNPELFFHTLEKVYTTSKEKYSHLTHDQIVAFSDNRAMLDKLEEKARHAKK